MTFDHRSVDWSRVARCRYRLTQHHTYEYPGPITNLRHRLVVVPPSQHGTQRLLSHRVAASGAEYTNWEESDRFGNRVDRFDARQAGEIVDFSADVVVERWSDSIRPTLAIEQTGRFLEPTRLTMPDSRLLDAAADLVGPVNGEPAEELAALITGWVHRAMVYANGFTHVGTTAAEALYLRHGVCQDFAHIMLALCRLCSLPARYVSGHLLGDGGSHAWVEVLAPLPDRPDRVEAIAFDPTHGRRAGLNYITIAVGQDYADVTPTSGTYTAPYQGFLQSSKRATITALDYESSSAAR